MIFRRRDLLKSGLAGAALAGAPAILRAQQVFTDYPFALGVAAGDPAPDGFVIWTRLCPLPLAEHGGMPMKVVSVDWAVAEDFAFKQIVAKGSAPARPDLAHAVHVEVTGLKPARPYWYRFAIGTEISPYGRARTTPAPTATLDNVRFGVAGCQNWEDGYYTAYRHLSEEADLDFVFHYGDYIYEDRIHPLKFNRDHTIRPLARQYFGQETFSLDDYRRRYAQEKADPDLQAAHAAAAWYCTFDDHDVYDDWGGDYIKTGTPPEIFALRRAGALQAWYEHMPVRDALLPRAGRIAAYRRARYGDLVDLHLLDTRQYRTPPACGGGFTAVCDAIHDPKAEIAGRAQERWLADGLKLGARWNAVAQQVMMMPLDRRVADEPMPIRNMDSWGGFTVPLNRTLDLFRGHGNVVVITGDTHENWAGELRRDDGKGEAVAVEFVGSSITSEGDGSDRRIGTDRIMANNPCVKFENDQRGYLVCDVGRDEWRTHVRVMDGVFRPGGKIATRATLSVPRGKPVIAVG